MKKIYYNKLIRDGIVSIIKNRGSTLEVKKLNREEFEKELLRKVEEEAGGIAQAKNKQDIIAELADLLIVIDEIKKVKKIGVKELKMALRENMRKKGGFKRRLWLVWSSDDGYKTNEKINESK